MADLKISQFVDGGTVQITDQIATNRGGVNTHVFVKEGALYDVGSSPGDLILWNDDGAGNPQYPPGDVSQLDIISSSSNIGDNRVVRGDGGTNSIQESGVLIDDSSNITPLTNDTGALGSSSNSWSDLFLATGGVINFNNGNATITHSTGSIAVNVPITANSFIPSSSTAPSNGMYLPSANTLGFAINSTAELALNSSAFYPATSDGNALGTSSNMWSDLFLASGGVINFNNGDVTVTHSANTLAFAGASNGYTFDTPIGVASGGSGRNTATAYAVICGGTTSTGAHQSVSSVGTAGQVLTSNGAGALPTFQTAASSSITIGTPTTLTNQTFVDYAIAADTKEFTCCLDSFSSNGSSLPLIRLIDSGGVETTAYGGSGGEFGVGSAIQNNSSGMYFSGQGGAGRVLSGAVTFTNMGGNRWAASGALGDNSNGLAYTAGGAKTLSDPITGVRLTFVNGTDQADAGVYNVIQKK